MELHRTTRVYVLALVLLTTNFVFIGSMSLPESKDDLQNETSLKKSRFLKKKYKFSNNEIPHTSFTLFLSDHDFFAG